MIQQTYFLTFGYVFSAFIAAYLRFVPKKTPSSIKGLPANSEVPDYIKDILDQKLVTNAVPWSDVVNVVRSRLMCTLKANCTLNGAAWTVELPKLQRPGYSPNSWDPGVRQWRLSTQGSLRTGWPSVYPIATVIVVPEDTPKYVESIVDFNIVPMLAENEQTINMGSDWATNGIAPGLDVTGNAVPAFVVQNNADHDIFFCKVPESEMNASSEYWTVPKGCKVVFWQIGDYWPVQTTRTWNAFLLPTMSSDQAAYIAERFMWGPP